MNKILLVTGAASPIGTSFIIWADKNILNRYEKVLILYNETLPIKLNNPIYEYIKLNFQYFYSQVLNDLSNFEIDIFHSAALVPSKMQKPEDYMSINYEGPYNLILKLLLKNKVNIFNISTTAVYDKNKNEILYENSSKQYLDTYGISKYIFENELQCIADINFNFINIRIPMLLTKNVKNNFFSRIKESLNNNNKIQLSYPLNLFNSVILDIDIFNLFILFINNKIPNDVYNLASSDPITLLELLSQNGIINYEEIIYNKAPQIISIDKILKYYNTTKTSDSVKLFLKLN